MDWSALIVGILVFGGALRAIMLGGASFGGAGLRRDENPVTFWLVVAIAGFLSASLIWRGLHPVPVQ